MILPIKIMLCLSLLISNISFAKETLRVAYFPIMDHLILPVSHALDNQHYQYIDVEPRLFTKWSQLTGALKAGKIDAAFILVSIAIDLYQKGEPIKVVLLAHRNGSGITVNKNIQSISDFKGKKIGVPGFNLTHLGLLDAFLKKGNLSLEDVILKPISPPDMTKAMGLGFIEGFIVAEPFGSKAIKQNKENTFILSRDIFPDHITSIIVMRNEFLTQHPEEVKEWLKSLVQASEWIEADRLQTDAQTTAKLVGNGVYYPHSTDLITSSLTEPLEKINFNNLKPMVEDFQIILNLIREAGIGNNDIDLTNFIDTQFYPTSPQ